MSRTDDEMITLGGGEVDEMELYVRRLKGADEMVEELPVIASADESPAVDEPEEITIGGSDNEPEPIEEPEPETVEPEAAQETVPTESEEITIGGTDDEPEPQIVPEPEPEPVNPVEKTVPAKPEEITIGGAPEQDKAPVRREVKTPAKDKKQPEKPEKKEKEEASGLPEPVIAPRDLDKVRAAKAQARPADDASLNTADQDFLKHFLVSASPHIHCGETTRVVMQDVVIALVPAALVSIVYFGWRSLLLIALCVLTCVLTEYVCRRIMKRRQTISDFSAAVTGILLAFCLPPEINPLFAVAGCIVAIVVVKQMFGGIGCNFANPAATARIVMMLSFPAAMTTYTRPFFWMENGLDTVSSATPLVDPESYSLVDLMLGVHGGSLGETCVIALLLGGAYLLLRGVITWHIPVAFIGTVALLSLPFGLDPIEQLCSGGLMLGAIFMATDYVTSPVNRRGQLIYGVGCGLLTIVIRRFGSMAEGVSFAILLMNILSPLIERMTTPKAFGEEGKQA